MRIDATQRTPFWCTHVNPESFPHRRTPPSSPRPRSTSSTHGSPAARTRPAAATSPISATSPHGGGGTAHDAIVGLLRRGPAAANRAVMAYRASAWTGPLLGHRQSPPGRTQDHGPVRPADRAGQLVVRGRERAGRAARRHARGPGLVDLQAMTGTPRPAATARRPRRDRAILALLFDLGLRRAEFCGLDLADVEPAADGSPAAVADRRQGPARAATAHPARGDGRGPWRRGSRRGATTRGRVFHRLDGPDPDRRSASRANRCGGSSGAWARRPSVGRVVRPHGLRHAAITAALDAGKDVRIVQKFSRHKTLDMVLKYDDERGDIAGEVAGLLSRRRGR